jgi:hypothetical protein
MKGRSRELWVWSTVVAESRCAVWEPGHWPTPVRASQAHHTLLADTGILQRSVLQAERTVVVQLCLVSWNASLT